MKQITFNSIIAGSLLISVAVNAGEIIPQAGSVAIAGAGSQSASKSFSGSGASAGAGASANASPTIVVGSGNTYEASDLSEGLPAVFIPALTTSNGTCMGSFSTGLVVSGFGGGVGKTYTSDECNARFNSNQMNALGYKYVAMEIMCGLPEVFAADARNSAANGTKPRCAQPAEPAEKVAWNPNDDYQNGLELARKYEAVSWFPADEKLIGAR